MYPNPGKVRHVEQKREHLSEVNGLIDDHLKVAGGNGGLAEYFFTIRADDVFQSEAAKLAVNK